MADFIDRVQAAVGDTYRIEKELGGGGMSRVFLAEEVELHRKVVIKVLPPDMAAGVNQDRFRRGVQLAASRQHPHVVPLLTAGSDDDLLYYVMPYIEGESLRAKLSREGELPLKEVIRIIREVTDALSFAHRHGVVHRDIKPDNILIHDGQALVADFGIALAVSHAGATRLTETGLSIGTPQYMSPEQGQGHGKVDARSDIYSLGCVLYEMIAGEPPFDGPTAHVIIARHQHEAPRSLTMTRSTVPASVEFAIESALAKVPADRPETAERFVEMLDEPPPTRKMKVLWGKGRLVGSFLIVTAAIVLAVLASTTLNNPDVTPWLDGRPASVVVIPYHTSTTSQREQALADELADDITRELNNWDSIRAVPSVSLSGPIFDLGLSGPTFERIDDGIEVSRAVNAQALAALTVNLRGDTAFVEATLFDTRTNESVGQPLQASALVHDMTALAAPIVYGILAIDEAEGDPIELRRLTHMPAALSNFIEGQRHLAGWRLTDAAASFRQAIALDTMFALAIHSLAQTLYWEAAQDAGRLESLGPQISQLSAVSVRLDRKSTRLNSSHTDISRMPSSA